LVKFKKKTLQINIAASVPTRSLVSCRSLIAMLVWSDFLFT